ncbi:hypothetical protein HDU96_010426 [Phlyctochytrium bullatum]|nr:hypothetical protein HDU96_010426 [Phlyctochytrium bullatum]
MMEARPRSSATSPKQMEKKTASPRASTLGLPGPTHPRRRRKPRWSNISGWKIANLKDSLPPQSGEIRNSLENDAVGTEPHIWTSKVCKGVDDNATGAQARASTQNLRELALVPRATGLKPTKHHFRHHIQTIDKHRSESFAEQAPRPSKSAKERPGTVAEASATGEKKDKVKVKKLNPKRLSKAKQEDLNKPLVFELEDGCPHEKHKRQHVRFVDWYARKVLWFCSFGCKNLKNRRLVAVSHVWGETETIRLKGIPWNLPKADNKNLRDAFEGCEPGDLYWLDILSINQQNPEELFASTQLMSVVYGKTDYVNLWLPETHPLGSDYLPWPYLAAIKPTREGVIQMITATVKPNEVQFPYQLPTGEPLTFNLAFSLLWTAFEEPWFARVWTTQEMALAAQLTFNRIPFQLENLTLWGEMLRSPFIGVPRDIEDAFVEMNQDIFDGSTWDIRSATIVGLDVCCDLLQKSINLRLAGTWGKKADLLAAYMAVCQRDCKYLRDKVLTLSAILGCEVKLPEFNLDDHSHELSQRLWHHAVVDRVGSGDMSIMQALAPGKPTRTIGLWHPSVDPELLVGICKMNEGPESHGASINLFPYRLEFPTEPERPAVLRDVWMLRCDAYLAGADISPTGFNLAAKINDVKLLTAFNHMLMDLHKGETHEAELDFPSSFRMIESLSPKEEPGLQAITGSFFAGLVRLGSLAAPLWIPPWFVWPNFMDDPKARDVCFSVQLAIPADAASKGRARVWVFQADGTWQRDRGSPRVERYRGVIGAAWIDFDLVPSTLYEQGNLIDLTLP